MMKATLALCLYLFFTVSTFGQIFSSTGGPVALDGGCSSLNVTVSGIGTLTPDYGFNLINLNVTCPDVSAITIIEVVPPLASSFSIAGSSSFPNGGANLTNTCFALCSGLDDVNSTSDVAPYSNCYFPETDWSSLNSGGFNADGIWQIFICGPSSGSFDSWFIEFGPLIPFWEDSDLTETVTGECGVDDLDDLINANLPIAQDNCGDQMVIEVDFIETFLCSDGHATQSSVFFTAEDGDGNTTSENYELVIILDDTQDPVIENVPSSQVINCTDPFPSIPSPTAFDDCDEDLTTFIEESVEVVPGECMEGFDIEVHNYDWFVEDGCGNFTSASWTLTVVNEFSIDLGPDIINCDGSGPVVLDAGVSGAFYNWSTGETTQMITVGNGSYSVTVTTDGGCCAVDEILINVGSGPDVSASGATITCAEPNPHIVGSSETPGVTYNWSGPGGFISTDASPAVVLSGEYILTVTDPVSGCTSMDTVQVIADNVIPDVMLDVSPVNCAAGNLTISATSLTANVIYDWTGPQGFSATDSAITVSAQGTYTVMVTAPNGCTAMDSAALPNSLSILTAEVSTGLAIQGDDGTAMVEIDGGQPPYAIFWDTGDTTMTVSNLLLGAHTVIVTDQNGCEIEVPFEIEVLPTVCDFPATPVDKRIIIDGAFDPNSPVLESVLLQQCVSDLYEGEIPDGLLEVNYLFQSAGGGSEMVELEILAPTDGSVRAVIFGCDCSGVVCVQACVGVTDGDGKYAFAVPAGFYNIIFLGTSEGDFSFILNEEEPVGPSCEVDAMLMCGSEIAGQLAGPDDYNTVNPAINIYDCYNGNRPYTGPDQVYSIQLSAPQRVNLELNASSGMGMFLYNFLCGGACIAFAETPENGGLARIQNLQLTSGLYYLVIDQFTDTGGKDYTLELSCNQGGFFGFTYVGNLTHFPCSKCILCGDQRRLKIAVYHGFDLVGKSIL